jgi:hypothetical protein
MAAKKLVCVGLIFLMVLCAGCTSNSPSKPKDSDKDGYADKVDAFPLDPLEWKDTDNDTHGDNSDKFPTDPKEWADSDNDTHGDNSDRFPFDATEWKDSDNDSWGDNRDKFPLNPKEWNDTDQDGYGDNCDKFPSDPLDWNDTDNDGVGDHLDRFPQDPKEWDDSDNDGIGDHRDDYPHENDASVRLLVSSKGSYFLGPDFYVYGIITNNKTTTVGRGFNITIELYENGTFIKENMSNQVDSVNITLAPGETMAFSINIDDAYHKGTSYIIEVKGGFVNYMPRYYLSAKNVTGSYNASLKVYSVSGQMWNNATVTLTNIHFTVAFYDINGTVVDVQLGANSGCFCYPKKSAPLGASSLTPYAYRIVSYKFWFFYK